MACITRYAVREWDAGWGCLGENHSSNLIGSPVELLLYPTNGFEIDFCYERGKNPKSTGISNPLPHFRDLNFVKKLNSLLFFIFWSVKNCVDF